MTSVAPKIRRGRYTFLAWRSDHPPRHVHRLGTSPTQLYRLLDQTNYRKSVDQLLRLLQALDCDVQLVVRAHKE